MTAYEGLQACGNAFIVQSDAETKQDPKNHAEAMADDASGWLEAETAELDNHKNNGSFELIDRSLFEQEAPNRRLVKLVWVYKRKRNGRMKARLCVQGCTQQPGGRFRPNPLCDHAWHLSPPLIRPSRTVWVIHEALGFRLGLPSGRSREWRGCVLLCSPRAPWEDRFRRASASVESEETRLWHGTGR